MLSETDNSFSSSHNNLQTQTATSSTAAVAQQSTAVAPEQSAAFSGFDTHSSAVSTLDSQETAFETAAVNNSFDDSSFNSSGGASSFDSFAPPQAAITPFSYESSCSFDSSSNLPLSTDSPGSLASSAAAAPELPEAVTAEDVAAAVVEEIIDRVLETAVPPRDKCFFCFMSVFLCPYVPPIHYGLNSTNFARLGLRSLFQRVCS